MVDQDSGRVSRAPPYSGTVLRSLHHAAYGDFTLFVRLSQNLSAIMKFYHSAPCGQTALQPRHCWRFRPLRFRSPLLSESRVPFGTIDFFSRGTEMVQFPQSCFLCLFIQQQDDGLSPAGLPHSAINGSADVCSSPSLFAAYHGLLRLNTPRHSP